MAPAAKATWSASAFSRQFRADGHPHHRLIDQPARAFRRSRSQCTEPHRTDGGRGEQPCPGDQRARPVILSDTDGRDGHVDVVQVWESPGGESIRLPDVDLPRRGHGDPARSTDEGHDLVSPLKCLVDEQAADPPGGAEYCDAHNEPFSD
ncbi:hypothetical protein DF18_33155 [Streptomyces rimosus]|nr:hypothetical protein DF18_33155 [Streptomyces rimosus]